MTPERRRRELHDGPSVARAMALARWRNCVTAAPSLPISSLARVARVGKQRSIASCCRSLCSSANAASHRVGLSSVPEPTTRQLISLALAGGVPFIGFGFADNAIMIMVGDQIDSTLGVKLGLSTLAAAGLGNLISDVVGISLGEVIEAWTARFFTAPPLSPNQLQLRTTRLVKGGANTIGISIGCLLGMAPLLFMHDRKAVFFDDDEMAIYHQQFAPYGVSPQQFFSLLHHGKWRTADAGTTMVAKGEDLRSVFFIFTGAAQGVSRDVNGHERVVAVYSSHEEDVTKHPAHVRARPCMTRLHARALTRVLACAHGCAGSGSASTMRSWLDPRPSASREQLCAPCITACPRPTALTASPKDSLLLFLGYALSVCPLTRRPVGPSVGCASPVRVAPQVARGCIIGGTALVDASIAGRPYPNTVSLTQRTKYLEWSIDELRAAMKEDKGVEAAVLSTLYLDLIRGRREQRLSQKARDDEETRAALVREYGTMLRAVLADGLVHPLEKAMLADYASKHAVSKDEHRSFLVAEGWTDLEFEHGVKDNLKTERVRVCEHERASMSVRA